MLHAARLYLGATYFMLSPPHDHMTHNDPSAPRDQVQGRNVDEQDTSRYRIGQPSRAGMPSPITPDPSSEPAQTANRWLRILQHVTEGAIAHLDLEGLLHEL